MVLVVIVVSVMLQLHGMLLAVAAATALEGVSRHIGLLDKPLYDGIGKTNI